MKFFHHIRWWQKIPMKVWLPVIIVFAIFASVAVTVSYKYRFSGYLSGGVQGLLTRRDVVRDEEGIPSLLDGEPLPEEVGADRPIAVMVENFSPIRARQKGLEQASIVYEALAEGGITRFLAIFNGSPAGEIGPVRSARVYFISWASELRAPYVHIGGSPAALENLKTNGRVLNVDEFDSSIIWRDKTLDAPHNAYTSVESIEKYADSMEFSSPFQEPRFIFKDPDDESGLIHVVSIEFSTQPYVVKFVYDETERVYKRFNGGVRHGEIKAANVIAQYVSTGLLDDEGRLSMQTNGTGKALVFRDGKVIEAVWQKDRSVNAGEQKLSMGFTRFYDLTGAEIPLNRGQTWIEVVPEGKSVNYF
jgi:hypothetical protein